MEKIKFPALNTEEADLQETGAADEGGLMEVTVEQDDNGSRLDKVLCARLEISRKRAADLMDEGRVQVNGAVLKKASAKVWTDDKIDVDMPPAVSREVLPENIPLDVVF